MIEIDGSQGEGGGQILRSALALSMATGRAFRLVNARAGREKPGLKQQHVTCVRACAAVCCAEVTGDGVGSMEVGFVPGAVIGGAYHFAIGTAGSTTMVLQAVLPALLRAEHPSRITVEGGTYNKSAPPWDFFAGALAPLLERTGVRIAATQERAGFYPRGGGRLVVEIEPVAAVRRFSLLERGKLVGRSAVAYVSRLSPEIGAREVATARERLRLREDEVRVEEVRNSVGPGNAVCIELRHEHVTEVFSAVGERGRSAEAVAREACDEAAEYLKGGWAVGPHLADQLMVPLALLGGGEYATGPLTEHSVTNMGTVRAFGGEVRFADGVVTVEAIVRA